MRQREKHFGRREKILGQFLTPPEVAKFIIQFISPRRRRGIDPSCGDGVFLKALSEVGFSEIIGIDTDIEVLKKLELPKAKLFHGDGLRPFGDIDNKADVVVSNPPFSAKYGRITDQAILSLYKLGKGRKSQAVEILFLERFLQLASSKGRIGIILPAGIFSSLPLRYVREFILEQTRVLGIVSLPRNIFRGKTSSKTCILFLEKGKKNSGKSFLGIAESLEDLPKLLEAYINRTESEKPFAFWKKLSADSFEPFKGLKHRGLPKLEEFIHEMFSGRTEYGERRVFCDHGIPFTSAKTVTWLGVDFTKDRKFIQPGSIMDKKRAHTKVGDVLFVRVGVGCSGRVAVVTDPLEEGVADDWIYIIRPYRISPFYLALFFATCFGKSQLEALKRGVGTVTIPQKLLKEIRLPIPPPDLEDKLTKGYLKMVDLRRKGRVQEAEEKFRSLVKEIENWGNFESL